MFMICVVSAYCFCFVFHDTATTVIFTYCHTLSLHDALPISRDGVSENAALLVLKLRRPLGHERRHAFFLVLRRKRCVEYPALETHAFGDRKSTRLNSSH